MTTLKPDPDNRLDGAANSLDELAQWPAERLTMDDLRAAVAAGEVDSVIVATPDTQGSLYGKSMPADMFLAGHHMHFSSGPLIYDIEWVPLVGGFPRIGPQNAWADFVVDPDMRSLRRLANLPGSAIVFGTGRWLADDALVQELPRHILQRQLQRLEDRGLAMVCAAENEFYVFPEDYASAREKSYARLTRSGPGAADYAILQMGMIDGYLKELRRTCVRSGIPIETIKHEWGNVQLELTLTYSDAMEAADRITLFKMIAKQVAAQHGLAATFMARYSLADAGSSGHIHTSLWDPREKRNLLPDSGDPSRLSIQGRHWLGGLMAMLPSLMPMLCPNVNSYKRLDPDIFAPGTVSWGFDVRTASFRVLGKSDSLHIETRIPGADANFYLALAAIAAAGMHGLDNQLEPIGDAAPDASTVPGPKLPLSLREALERFRCSEEAAAMFGSDVVGHIAASADHELAIYDREVSDIERRRLFEIA
jgi:glutamine synthetase